MAQVTGQAFPDNQGGFKFNLDGLATSKQMDDLIRLMSKRSKKNKTSSRNNSKEFETEQETLEKQAVAVNKDFVKKQQRFGNSVYDFADSLDYSGEELSDEVKTLAEKVKISAKEFNATLTTEPNEAVVREQRRALNKQLEQLKTLTKREQDLEDATENLADSFASGNISSGLKSFTGTLLRENKILTLGLTAFGTVIGALRSYSIEAGNALKLGVAGNVLDFAVGAKTAGVSLEQFRKGLEETGGGFASLGDTTVGGALAFSTLVDQVRKDTMAYSNLGMTVDELSVFTAQQVKIAVGQGFKGRQAQEQVRKNSMALAEDLQSLSEKTGKSVMELAAAANKLASDPLVAAMVSGSKMFKGQVSSAVSSFAANMKGVFGELGESLASDAIRSSAAGLPLAMTETGRNLLIAGQPLYNELTRLATAAKNGVKVSEEDTARLAELAKQEVEARGQTIRTMAMLEGPAGDSARQILQLAQQAEFYNSEQGKQAQNTRKFVAEQNKLTANLQQMLVPLLEVLNTVDWAGFSAILAGAAEAVKGLLNTFKIFANILGAGDGAVGKVLGFSLAVGGLVMGITAATRAVLAFSGALVSKTSALSGILDGINGKNSGGRLATATRVAGSAIVGGAIGNSVNPAETTSGAVGGTVGAVAGAVGGSVAGAAAGRLIGGAIGSVLGPIGTIAGSTLGTIAGNFIGDKLAKVFEESNDNKKLEDAQKTDSNRTLAEQLAEFNSQMRVQNQLSAQSVNIQRDTGRNIKNLPSQ